VAVQCRECKNRLEELLSRKGVISSSAAQTLPHRELDPLLVRRTKALLPLLAALIQSTVDPEHMEELLALNDALTSLLQRASPPTTADVAHHSPHQSPVELRSPIHPTPGSSNSLGLENGNALGAPLPVEVNVDSVQARESDSDDHEPFSPRIDKGKGKAMEEASPVLQKLIMSPSFSITDSDSDDEEQQLVAEDVELDEDGRPIPLPSPTDRYVIVHNVSV
jgi:protein phosphatase 1 regulatory subunit 37